MGKDPNRYFSSSMIFIMTKTQIVNIIFSNWAIQVSVLSPRIPTSKNPASGKHCGKAASTNRTIHAANILDIVDADAPTSFAIIPKIHIMLCNFLGSKKLYLFIQLPREKWKCLKNSMLTHSKSVL